MKIILQLFVLGSLLTIAAHAQSPKLKEKFDVQKDQTVRVAGTDLELKVLTNGHATHIRYYIFFCIFEAKLNGELKEQELNLGETLTFDGFRIRLTGVKPWTLRDERLSCKFIVTKNKK